MKKASSLDDTTTVKGIWWMPSNPEKRLQGEITYGPISGAKLDLYGHFYEGFNDRKLTRRITVHGTTFDSKSVSLFEAIIEKSQIHLPGGSSSLISSYSGILGGHYLTREEVAFRKVTVRFNGLRDWIWTTGIRLEYSEGRRGFRLEYDVPGTISAGQIGDISVSLEFSARASPGFNSHNISEDCLLVLEAPQMTAYERFEDVIYSFQRFLTLAIQRPVYGLNICGHIDTPSQKVGDDEIFRDYVVLRKISVEENSAEPLIPQKMLFSFPELTSPLSELFPRFFELLQKVKASADLFFSTVYHQGQSARMRFITLAQSIEGLHRATFSGKHMPDEEYETVRRALIDAIPADLDSNFRNILESRLIFLNEHSLARRVKDLFSQHDSLLSPLLGTASKFAREVADARNALTHPMEERTSINEDYRKLYHLSDKLYFLIEIYILGKSGILDELQMDNMISRNRCAVRLHYGPV